MVMLNTLLLVLTLLFPTDPPGRSKAMEEGIFSVTEHGVAIDGQTIQGETPPRHLRLAILPDRTTGRDWGLPYLEHAVEDLVRLHPDAIFCVGDLIQGYTRNPAEWDRQVEQYLAIVDGLPSTFYPVPGNHDVISGTRDPSDTTFVDRYRTRFGPVHYVVQFEEGTVIVLFSDEALDDRNVSFSDDQLKWLEGVLQAAPKEKPIALLMHRPLWRYGAVKWDERVHPLLAANGVDAVIAGHFHALHREPDRDGIAYHLLGVCGGAIDQHPLTGQFHHFTMLDLGPGDRLNVMHMPVGVTMPDDVVLRIDQDRAFKLKRAFSNAAIDGVLPDARNGPVDETITLRLKNPTDVPVTFAVAPATRVKSWDAVSFPFTAATPLDTRNESTTSFDTPFEVVTPTETVSLEPGASTRVPIAVTAPQTETSPQPPQLLITASFIDSQDRRVPVFLHRRIPIERTMTARSIATFSISAWQHSVYEVPEEDSSVTIDLSTASPTLQLTIEDDLVCFDGGELLTTRRNPSSDLVRILLKGDSKKPHEFVLAPADPARRLFNVESGEEHPHAWTLEKLTHTSHTILLRLPKGEPNTLTGLQIEVADNDETYHTQWRRLAPQGQFLTIRP